MTSLKKGVESGHMVAVSTEGQHLSSFGPEVLQPQRHSVPFVREILRIGLNDQINIPTVDACFLAQEHSATTNYLLAQTIRQNSLDTTGILGHLLGVAHDPSDAAFYAAASAQQALDALLTTKGVNAQKQMLCVLFEQAPPTLEDVINLDATWGATVNGLKSIASPQAVAFRERNLTMLRALAQYRSGGQIAHLAQREFESGGSNEGHLSDVTESLLLPKIEMSELDIIVPPMLRHGYGEPKESQIDIVRFLRRGGILGNDLTRSIIDYINGREQSSFFDQHQQLLP